MKKIKKKIINVTPHIVRFQSSRGEIYTIPSDYVISATTADVYAGKGKQDVELVKPEFRPTPEGLRILERIKKNYPDAIVVGSIIAAQAYPGEVYGLIPMKGYERAPVPEKRARDDVFSVFGG